MAAFSFMVKTLGRIKKGDLLLTGETKERLPVVQNGLVHYYPMDGTSNAFVPGKIQYVRDWVNGSTANTGNHWVEIKAIDYSGTNVALNKSVTAVQGNASYPISRITDGDTTSANYADIAAPGLQSVVINLGSLYNLYQIMIWHYYADGRTYHSTKTEVSSDGVYWYPVFDSAIEGEYAETSTGHILTLNTLGTTVAPSTNTNTTQRNDGLYIDDGTTNLYVSAGEPSPAYNNGGTVSLVDSYLVNAPVPTAKTWVLTKTGSGNQWNGWESPYGGILGSLAVGDWVTVSGWYRSATDVGVGSFNLALYTTDWASTVSTSASAPIVYDGQWHYFYMSVQVTTAYTGPIIADGPSWNYSTSPGVMYINGIQWEKKAWPTAYAQGTRGAGRLDIPFNLQPPYTINFKHTGKRLLSTVVDQGSSPMILQMGDYYGNASISIWNYIKILRCYIKGNSSSGWTATGSYDTFTDTTWNSVEHTYTLVAVDTLNFKLYMDGVFKGTLTSSEAVTNIKYLSMGNTSQPIGMYRNLSIYNRALSDMEIVKLAKESFSVTNQGNLISTVSENSLVRSGIYFPLTFDGNDITRSIQPSVDSNNHYTLDGVYLDKGTTNQVSNPSGDSGAVPTATTAWNMTLHADALDVSNWTNGYNGGVKDPSIGYHAKWVNEGMDGRACMKFMDLNSAYNYTDGSGAMTHRWLGICEGLGTPNALGWAVGNTITISWNQKVDTKGRGGNVGIYYKSVSSGSYGFNNSITTITTNKIGIWERVSYTFTVTSDWDLTSGVTIYVYGTAGPEGILWVDDVQVEKNSYPSGFVNGTSGYSHLAWPYASLFPPTNTGSFTIVYWAKYTQSGIWRISGTWPYFYFGVNTGNNTVFSWMENSANTGNTNTQRTISGTAAVPANQWVMIACSVTVGSSIRLFYNGKFDAAFSSAFSLTSAPTDFSLHDITPTNTSYPFNGSVVRDLMVFKRALADSEILDIYKTNIRAYKSSNIRIQGRIQEGQAL